MSSARAALLAALVAALLLALARAGAVGSVSPAAGGLRESRLYVAPAVAETVDARTRRRLARDLAQRREPIYVALVAFAPGDAFNGDAPRFLTVLAGRLGRPGVYVTYDARGSLWTRPYRTSPAVADPVEMAARTVNLEDRFDSPPGPRLTHMLAALDDPDLAGRARRAEVAFDEYIRPVRPPAARPPRSQTTGGDDEDGSSGGLLTAIVISGIVVAGGGMLLLRRRRGARPVDDRPVLPGRVFSLAREASRDQLVEQADASLIALSDLIDAAPTSTQTQRALDAYEAAERALRSGERDLPDLVGALVCADLGRQALSSERGPQRPCTYDPRHAPAHGRPVRVEGTRLHLCQPCRADARAGRPADVLRDASGRPYFDADTPWAASGYGAWSDPVRAVLDARRYPPER